MTGLLTDLMHDRADHLDAPDLDLARITRDGDRRVRRRRTTLVGGIAAAVAIGVVAVPSLAGDGDGGREARDLVADGTAAAPVPLSWTTGSTLRRSGAPDVDLGVDVRAWVWVGEAVALTDDERRVLLWTDGALEEVGTAARPDPDDAELVADGARVAWVDPDRRLVLLDTASGETSTQDVSSAGDVRVTALDGDAVYAVGGDGVLAWDTRTGEVEVLDPSGKAVVIDAEDGTLLRALPGRRARVEGPGRDLTLTTDSFANLSPDGAHVVAESNDEGILLDTSTGDRVPLATGYDWALPFQWLDADAVAVLAFSFGEDTEEPFLVRCVVSTGACDEGEPLEPGFQLPAGLHFAQ
jgi:hypothetical protein